MSAPTPVANPNHQASERSDAPTPVAAVPLKLKEEALDEFMDWLGRHASKRLLSHAIPRFIGICEGELEITGTFKNKKVELKKKGFDLERVHEPLYWWTPFLFFFVIIQKGFYWCCHSKSFPIVHPK